MKTHLYFLFGGKTPPTLFDVIEHTKEGFILHCSNDTWKNFSEEKCFFNPVPLRLRFDEKGVDDNPRLWSFFFYPFITLYEAKEVLWGVKSFIRRDVPLRDTLGRYSFQTVCTKDQAKEIACRFDSIQSILPRIPSSMMV